LGRRLRPHRPRSPAPPDADGRRRPPLQRGLPGPRGSRPTRSREELTKATATSSRADARHHPSAIAHAGRAKEEDNGGVHAAAVCCDLHVPESRSLKAKRAAVRPIVDVLRHKYRLSVAEVDHQDQWQRTAIAVAVVAESNGRLRQVLEQVERYVAGAPDVELIDVTTAYLDPEGGGNGPPPSAASPLPAHAPRPSGSPP